MTALAPVTLGDWFHSSARRFPEHTALVVDGRSTSYRELQAVCRRVTTGIADHGSPGPRRICALLAYRSAHAYAGVLGILTSGLGYAPLNPTFPPDRTRTMLLRSGATTVVVGAESSSYAADVLALVQSPMTVLVLGAAGPPAWSGRCPQHRFVNLDEVAPRDDAVACVPHEDDIAYVLFTSGTTGEPKGVGVTHANANRYIKTTIDDFKFTAEDRISQSFDLTFDGSVHDLFVTWASGASLHVVPKTLLFAPGRFIREHGLTVWMSVPSVVSFSQRLGNLKPNAFPSLRHTLFGGEALLTSQVEAWRSAAPNSTIDNVYGPTEATVSVCRHRWDDEKSPRKCRNGVVPIGIPSDGQWCRIVDPAGRMLAAGEAGELYIAGSQLAPGYWDSPELTRERFVALAEWEGSPNRWYRTGDLAEVDEDGCILYHGRLDDQLKIRGFRVEPAEIESAIRAVTKSDLVAAIGWPQHGGAAESVVVFVGDQDLTAPQIIAHCQRTLPPYMVPTEVHFLAEFPRTPTGKTDRKAIYAIREQMAGAGGGRRGGA